MITWDVLTAAGMERGDNRIEERGTRGRKRKTTRT